ncbi:MAG: hypothetical protein K2N05_03230 [Muribaculaceae bacterium]|nr:hypothetical protein [Muribaculaceae bacterium]
MKRDMIFFSTNGQGLTLTSANHVANLAKEMIRREEAALSNITLYSTSVALIGSSSSECLSTGSTSEELESSIDKLYNIAKAKSLIAWLREAIKAKERLFNEVQLLNVGKYAEIKGITIPEMPEKGEPLTEDDYYSSLSVDERNRYYHYETLAAVLGKAIHPGGSLADAREDLDRRIRQPREITGEGRDTLVYSYSPTVHNDLVDDIYFRLQKQYREAQAKVNAFKHECKKAISESITALNAEYLRKLSEYRDAMQLLNAEFSEYVERRSAEIGDYKILIPSSLKDIFEKVSGLGKKEE